MTDQQLSKILDWLRSEWIRVPVPPRFDGIGPMVLVKCESFFEFIRKIDLEVFPTLEHCLREGWIQDICCDVMAGDELESDSPESEAISRLGLEAGKHRLVGILHSVFVTEHHARTSKVGRPVDSIPFDTAPVLDQHQFLILRHLLERDAKKKGPIGREELALAVNRHRKTIKKPLDDLVKRGFVQEFERRKGCVITNEGVHFLNDPG